jgi:hypothetical protein
LFGFFKSIFSDPEAETAGTVPFCQKPLVRLTFRPFEKLTNSLAGQLTRPQAVQAEH